MLQKELEQCTQARDTCNEEKQAMSEQLRTLQGNDDDKSGNTGLCFRHNFAVETMKIEREFFAFFLIAFLLLKE